MADDALARHPRWNRVRQAARAQGHHFGPAQDIDHRNRRIGDGTGDPDDVVQAWILRIELSEPERANFAQSCGFIVENRRSFHGIELLGTGRDYIRVRQATARECIRAYSLAMPCGTWPVATCLDADSMCVRWSSK